MSKTRKKIPISIETDLLYKSHHTCSVCNVEGKGVIIHHIDGNPSNYSDDNLIVLCLSCHDQIEKEGKLGRKFRKPELLKYRSDWEQKVKQKFHPVIDYYHMDIKQFENLLDNHFHKIKKSIFEKTSSEQQILPNKENNVNALFLRDYLISLLGSDNAWNCMLCIIDRQQSDSFPTENDLMSHFAKEHAKPEWWKKYDKLKGVGNTNNYTKNQTSTKITEFSKTNYFNPKEFEEFLWGLSLLEPFTDDSSKSPMSAQRFVNLFKLMRECNLKVSDAINLKKRDFDLKNKKIRIRYPNSYKVQRISILPKDDMWIQKFLLYYNDKDKIFSTTAKTVHQYANDACRLAGLL